MMIEILDRAITFERYQMLKAEGKINDMVIENMLNWHHSGFNVYCGNAIWPHNDEGLENLARYIIRASFSQERMTYIPYDESADGVAKVIYDSKPDPKDKIMVKKSLYFIILLLFLLLMENVSAAGDVDLIGFGGLAFISDSDISGPLEDNIGEDLNPTTQVRIIYLEFLAIACHTTQHPIRKGGRPSYPVAEKMSTITQYPSLI